MPFVIKFLNNETFEKEFGEFYGCASRIPIYNSVFSKIMEDYERWKTCDFTRHAKLENCCNFDVDETYAELFGTIFVNVSEGNETITFKFNLSFEQNKDGDDICTVEYLGCFELIEEHLSRCEFE